VSPQDTRRPRSAGRLWFTPDRARFFLVPPDFELPPGDLTVRTLQATAGRFDEAALAAHEVEAGDARAHVDAGWERVPGVSDVMSALFGVTPGDLAVDPSKPREARRTLLEKASGLVGGWDEQQLADAEERLDRVGETVRREAGRLREEADKLGKALEERTPELERAVSGAGKAIADFLGRRPKDEPDEEPKG
jgi:hypothetical protein